MITPDPPKPPEHGERLWTFRVTREFEVSARSESEADALLDAALAGGAVAEPAPIQREQVVLEGGDVWGVLGWRPGGAPIERLARLAPAPRLSIGVIVWTSWSQDDPTVLADPDPEALARAMALLIHARISQADVRAAMPGFLESHSPPQDWLEPQDVDEWLEALRETVRFPAFSFHEVAFSGGADGTDAPEAARMLAAALAHRERELGLPGTAPAPDPAAGRSSPRQTR